MPTSLTPNVPTARHLDFWNPTPQALVSPYISIAMYKQILIVKCVPSATRGDKFFFRFRYIGQRYLSNCLCKTKSRTPLVRVCRLICVNLSGWIAVWKLFWPTRKNDVISFDQCVTYPGSTPTPHLVVAASPTVGSFRGYTTYIVRANHAPWKG